MQAGRWGEGGEASVQTQQPVTQLWFQNQKLLNKAHKEKNMLKKWNPRPSTENKECEGVIWKAKKTASGMWHKPETFFKQSEKNLPECEEVIKHDNKRST